MLLCICSVNSISHIMSQCGKDKKMVNKKQPSVSVMFSPHFDVCLSSITKKTYDNKENICFIY